MATGEITLRDLIAWTDLVSIDEQAPDAGVEDPLDRDVDWVITARSTPPMLPILRGGELVLLPERVVSESALNLQLLMRELTSQPVAGVVLDSDEPVQSPIPVLRASRIGPELESDLNRMLTTRRGEMLRAGTDIERIITAQRSRHTSPAALLRSLADHLDFELAVRTTAGNPIITTIDELPRAGSERERQRWLVRPLARNRLLMIGEVTGETRAMGRFVLERAAGAVQAALDEEASSAQDLQTRTRLINQALTLAARDPQEASGLLRQAGIAPDAPFRIAVAPAGCQERDVWPLLRAVGTPLDAGMLAGGPAWLLTESGQASRATEPPPGAWLVVSGPVTSASELGAASRQMAFLLGARKAGVIGGTIVRADDLARLGVVRLLFELWGSPLLDAFVEAMIGGLIREDRRGQLRETLRAYLAFGGAQRATAEHLGIHRNTLTYRLRQIRALLDVDPDDPSTRLSLHVAIVASELPREGPAMGR
jgi:purine catabolism regulator